VGGGVWTVEMDLPFLQVVIWEDGNYSLFQQVNSRSLWIQCKEGASCMPDRPSDFSAPSGVGNPPP